MSLETYIPSRHKLSTLKYPLRFDNHPPLIPNYFFFTLKAYPVPYWYSLLSSCPPPAQRATGLLSVNTFFWICHGSGNVTFCVWLRSFDLMTPESLHVLCVNTPFLFMPE